MGQQLRRLPVYLVLDVSSSMAGDPIEAVRQGVKALVADLRNDPQALETAFLSVITFSDTAQQVSPLTELLSFQEPVLDANGSTAFGAGLRTLLAAMQTDIIKGSAAQKGDWRPLVFIMTDGQPTDSWESAADQLKSAKLGNIIACAAGAAADVSLLQRVTESVVKLDTASPDTLKACFKWVSDSIKLTSQSLTPNSTGISLPKPTDSSIKIIP